MASSRGIIRIGRVPQVAVLRDLRMGLNRRLIAIQRLRVQSWMISALILALALSTVSLGGTVDPTTGALLATPSTQPASNSMSGGSTQTGHVGSNEGTSPATRPAATASNSTDTAAVTDVNRRAIKRGGDAASSSSQTTDPGLAAPAQLDMGRVTLALLAVIGLILFLRWGSRKLMVLPAGAGNSGLMQVVARTPLGPRQHLILVRVGKQLMVVGDSGGRLSGVGQIIDPDEVSSIIGKSRAEKPDRPVASFGGLLKRVSERFGLGRGSTAEDGGNEHDFMHDEAVSASVAPESIGHLGGRIDIEDEAELTSAVDESAPAVGLNQADAQAAVHAARSDILSLRARLRAVSQRLAEAGDTGGNASKPGMAIDPES